VDVVDVDVEVLVVDVDVEVLVVDVDVDVVDVVVNPQAVKQVGYDVSSQSIEVPAIVNEIGL
jgi:hypothetical protein